MLNPTGANLGGKCGFVWGGTAAFCMVVAFFCLPEMKGYVKRSAMFRCSTRADPDLLFQTKLPRDRHSFPSSCFSTPVPQNRDRHQCRRVEYMYTHARYRRRCKRRHCGFGESDTRSDKTKLVCCLRHIDWVIQEPNCNKILFSVCINRV